MYNRWINSETSRQKYFFSFQINYQHSHKFPPIQIASVLERNCNFSLLWSRENLQTRLHRLRLPFSHRSHQKTAKIKNHFSNAKAKRKCHNEWPGQIKQIKKTLLNGLFYDWIKIFVSLSSAITPRLNHLSFARKNTNLFWFINT